VELPVLSLGLVQAFLVCLARVAALVSTLPIIGTGSTPPVVKAMTAGLLALLLFPVVHPFIVLPDFSPVGLTVLVVTEAALGLMMGFLCQLIFLAVQVSGEVIGYKMGFAAANIFDPANNAQVSLLAQFQNVFAVLLFFTLRIDHLFLRALVASFRVLPPGHVDPAGGAPYLLGLFSHTFLLAVQLAAPILALLILVDVVLGVMSRVFPQLNAFIISFPLNIGIAFLVLGITLNLMAVLLQHEFFALEARFLHLFQAL